MSDKTKVATDNTATQAAEADAKMTAEAKQVEKDHRDGKGLRNGWSYSPTRTPRYMKASDARERRLSAIASGSLAAQGTPDRLLAAGFSEKPAFATRKRND